MNSDRMAPQLDESSPQGSQAAAPHHPEYAEVASKLQLAAVDLLLMTFERGPAIPSTEMSYRLNRNVSAFEYASGLATIEFEVDIELVNTPEPERVWASVSRWVVRYRAATDCDPQAVYEVAARVGFMTLYPYVRATVGPLVNASGLALPPLPTITVSSFPILPDLAHLVRRAPATLVVRG